MMKSIHENNETILMDAYEELYDIAERIEEALEEINELTLEIGENIEPLFSRLNACLKSMNRRSKRTNLSIDIVSPEEELMV